MELLYRTIMKCFLSTILIEIGVKKLKHNIGNVFFKFLLLLPVICIGIIFLLLLISGPINDRVAANFVKDLKQKPLPENTVIVEENAIADRICGNGDGVQYCGVLLLKSELSLDELKEYYQSQFNDNEDYNIVEYKSIDESYLEEVHAFHFNTEKEDNYYILYAWSNYNSIFTYFDWRGIN